MSKPFIIRDTRERFEFWDFPEDNYFAGTKVETVKYGDYTIEGLNNIFIDRKRSTGEVASNFLKEPFWNLMENVRGFEYRFLIMEFGYDDILRFPLNSHLPYKVQGRTNVITRIQPEFIIESLTRISVEYGVNTILAGNRNNAELFAHYVLKEILKNVPEI